MNKKRGRKSEANNALINAFVRIEIKIDLTVNTKPQKQSEIRNKPLTRMINPHALYPIRG